MADLAALTAAIEVDDRSTAVRVTRDIIADGLDPRDALPADAGCVTT